MTVTDILLQKNLNDKAEAEHKSSGYEHFQGTLTP